MYVVTVSFIILPEHISEFRSAVKIQAETSLKEESGCHQFDVGIDPDDPMVCFLYEIYSNEVAFNKHLGSSHFSQFDKKVSPWVKTKTVQTYEKI
jgi:autoinducer 2-degrading protein